MKFLGYGIITLLVLSGVFAFMGLLVWVFCISFGIPFSWNYVVGLWVTSLLYKVFFRGSK